MKKPSYKPLKNDLELLQYLQLLDLHTKNIWMEFIKAMIKYGLCKYIYECYMYYNDNRIYSVNMRTYLLIGYLKHMVYTHSVI